MDTVSHRRTGSAYCRREATILAKRVEGPPSQMGSITSFPGGPGGGVEGGRGEMEVAGISMWIWWPMLRHTGRPQGEGGGGMASPAILLTGQPCVQMRTRRPNAVGYRQLLRPLA